MFIKNYGLFWHRDEIDWHPGAGKRGAFRLLGRQGINRPSLRITDFREQKGIYILYGDYGPNYVGLTIRQNLGKRLKDHTEDDHDEYWNRFSWFGFRRVLNRKDRNRINELAALARGQGMNSATVIRDVEALLIKAMGLQNNIAQMKFHSASEWLQIKRHEAETLLNKLK
jgi:hypothetical protein